MSPPTIGRFSFGSRILRPINGLCYTRQPLCIIRAKSDHREAPEIRPSQLKAPRQVSPGSRLGGSRVNGRLDRDRRRTRPIRKARRRSTTGPSWSCRCPAFEPEGDRSPSSVEMGAERECLNTEWKRRIGSSDAVLFCGGKGAIRGHQLGGQIHDFLAGSGSGFVAFNSAAI